MKRLPDRPHLDQLKKQAKDLLAAYRSGDPAAIARFREVLPAAALKDDQAISNLALRLHDAQSCVAREYGFASWRDISSFVVARRAYSADRASSILHWLRLIYPADIGGGVDRATPVAAARMLEEFPELANGDAYVACAIGNAAILRDMTLRDRAWVDRPGGPLNLPPLVAVTHSSLVRLPEFRDRLLVAAKLLLEAGADPNQAVGSRWPPASLENPSDTYRLSALYGAAGQNRDAELTALLLDAGADPDDGESLYHALESPACTRLLLEAGAKVVGSNAFYRVMDLDSIEVLRLLLASGADPNEPARGGQTAEWGTPLLWAIRRGRSAAHIEALLEAGADPAARRPDGTSAYRVALQFGLTDVAKLLKEAGSGEPLSEEERFTAACAAGDETTARQIQARRPDLPKALPEAQLRLLPELAAIGHGGAVMLMVRLGWPIATRGGDWDASALNHAVFRGDAKLARFLLEHGASWKEQHGFGDNTCGTLSWASVNEPEGVGDWPGCAEALVAHGMPTAYPDQQVPGSVIINGQKKKFSDDVTEFLLGASPMVRPIYVAVLRVP
jgi:ankyrin repeat protein